MRTLKPLAFLAVAISLCVFPKLTAEEKLDLPRPKPKARTIEAPSGRTYPWESGDEVAIRRRLADRSGELYLDGMAFEQTVNFISDLTGLNFHVNWNALETAAIEKDKAVTIRVTGARFDQLLELMLRDVGGGEVELAHEIRGNVIEISTKEDLARSTIVVVYDVRGLMGYSTVHTLYGESTYICGDIERLIQVVQDMVDPESWREAGGNVGSIRNYGEMLTIHQTRTAHEQIWNMLNSMREGWKQERF